MNCVQLTTAYSSKMVKYPFAQDISRKHFINSYFALPDGLFTEDWREDSNYIHYIELESMSILNF